MKVKQHLGNLALQIIPVMIGVYLGFVVSDWSSDRQLRAKTSTVKETITAEVNENKNRVVSILCYHEMLRDSSRYYLQVKKYQMPSFFRGVNQLTLNNSAFETAIQTGLLNELPFSEIQALNNVYTNQKSYDSYWNILLSGLITFDITEDEQSVKKFLTYLSISMNDICIKEQQLVKEYTQLLNTLQP